MPCWNIAQLKRLERERIEKDRAEALDLIEQELAMGIATIVVDPLTGQVQLLNATPVDSMADTCILAALQTRNSVAFQQAISLSGAQSMDFVSIHGHSHSH